MAEPTDINKNKSTVSSMVDALRVELKELQSFKTVDPDVLGGKAGKSIPVPKKFTAEQTVAFMKQFPNMFPLANENAYFGIARALTAESPDLFDVASFDAYEEKFGKTMEMQEKGASASKNITTAKTPKAANQSVADLNPKTATLREVAEAYAEKSKRGKAFVTSSLQFFKGIADEPGSALRLFEKDPEGVTLLSKTFKGTEDTSTVKTAMQNLRQVGLTLKESVGPDTPEYKLLPDKAPNTDLNNRIFGRSEPAKAASEVAINPDKAKMSQLFAGVSKYLDNPNTKATAQAIIFNLNTGLRPNAAAGLQVTAYKPDSGAIYIEAETKGAKGRPVNIPLNPIADSILQDSLASGNKENFFVKPNGKVVTSSDMTDLLKDVKVKDIAFDAATGKYFDTLAPAGFTGKKGSALLRNIHATVGQSIGVDQDRLAFLQGRSLKSAGKSSTGELTTYQQAFPGAVGEVDRQNANMFASFWGDAAKEAGFDIKSKIPMPETRITTQTAGYEGYFDLPVREEVPQVTKPTVASPDPKNFDDLSPDTKGFFERNGIDFDNLIKNFGKAVEKIEKIPGAKKVLPIAAATSGYIAGKSEAADLGLPAVAQEVVGAFSGASELTPFSMTDIADTASGFDVAATEEQKRIDELRNRAISQRDSGMIPEPDRVPQAAPAQDQGFLSVN
tara:strand:- start:774 stop:2798 length:2025 start_codon:yes stop_codon:yes gene_type:complete